MDRRVDAEGRALDLARPAQDRAVIADLHQNTRRHLRPMETERDLVIAVVPARHGQGKMVEDALAEAVADGEAVRRREVDPRLPFRGIGGAALALLFDQSHYQLSRFSVHRDCVVPALPAMTVFRTRVRPRNNRRWREPARGRGAAGGRAAAA